MLCIDKPLYNGLSMQSTNVAMRDNTKITSYLFSKAAPLFQDDLSHLALQVRPMLQIQHLAQVMFFSIWKVEERNKNQMLMSVGNGPIRTWLMYSSSGISSGTTRLFFGSAVLPTRRDASGDHKMGRSFHILLGFHKIYSRILLWSAKQKLKKLPLVSSN